MDIVGRAAVLSKATIQSHAKRGRCVRKSHQRCAVDSRGRCRHTELLIKTAVFLRGGGTTPSNRTRVLRPEFAHAFTRRAEKKQNVVQMRVERRDEPRAVSKTGGGGFGVAVSNASAKRGVEKREGDVRNDV